MAAKEYFPGDSVHCTALTSTTAAVAANPSVSIVIRIKDPLDSRVIEDIAMTNLATGSYVYVYDTTTSSLLGEYIFEVIAVDGDGADVVIEDGSFILRPRRG